MAKPLEAQSTTELIAYIKGLRTEIQEVREEAEVYEQAFGRLDTAERKGLLHIVRMFSDNPQEGAELMADLAASVLGTDRKEEEDPKEQEDITMANDNDNEAPAWFAQFMGALDQRFGAIEQQLAAGAANSEEAEIRAYKAQARAYGFIEGTQEWVDFFNIAASGLAGDGDLEVALGLYEKIHGPVSTEDATEEEEAEEAAPAKEPKEFPKTGKAPAATTIQPAEEEPSDYSDAALRERALAFITKATADPLAGE